MGASYKRAFLLGVISICCVAFIGITALRPSSFFMSNKGFVSFRAKFAWHVRANETDTPAMDTDIGHVAPGELWNGSQGFVVISQWGTLLLAGLAAVALKVLKRRQPRLFDSDHPVAAVQEAGWWSSVTRKVRYVASYQLPPRDLWNHICGGLSVLDACLVACWLALTVLYLYFCTIWQYQLDSPSKQEVGAAQWALNRLDHAADASGTVLLFLMMIMFFPVSRSSFLKWVFGGAFHGLIKFHRWMAWGTIAIAVGHSCLFMVMWGAEGTLSYHLSYANMSTTKNVHGLVSTILMIVVAATANSWFRATYFKIFYPVHIICFVFIVGLSILHSPLMAYWLLPALLLYGMDRGFRYWQLANNWTVVTAADFSADANIVTVCLRWRKGPDAVVPGQTVYLRAPALSWFYSHPFSVADVEQEGDILKVCVHIRTVGKWTNALKARLSQGDSLKIQVEGPYESKLDYLQAAPVVVMITGGTGVTPVLAVLRRWARIALSGKGHVPQVHWIWTSRSLAELRLMGADLLAAATGHIGGAKKREHSSPTLGINTYHRSSTTLYNRSDTGTSVGDCVKQVSGLSTPPSPPASDCDDLTGAPSGFANAMLNPSILPPWALSQAPTMQSELAYDCEQAKQPTGITGWLHAALHYTGMEFELKAAEKRVDVAKSAGAGAKLDVILPPRPPAATDADKAKAAAAAGAAAEEGKPGATLLSRRLLSAHPMTRPWVYTITLVCTFVFAWLGFLLGNFFISYGARHTADGYNFLANGLVQLICIAVAAVLPAFVLQASLAVRYVVQLAGPEKASACLRCSVAVDPEYVMTAKDEAVDAGSLQLQRGRPKFASLLQRVREEHPHLQQIDVVVAGPDGICSMVQELCQQYTSAPALVCRRAAYHQ